MFLLAITRADALVPPFEWRLSTDRMRSRRSPLEGSMSDVGLDSALPEAATWESVARRALDLTAASLALLVLAVPLIVIGLMIRWTKRGSGAVPAAAGRLSAARRSPCASFRTMCTGVGDDMLRELIARRVCAARTPRWAGATSSTVIPGSPRIGAFLRKDQPGRAAAADQRAARRDVSGRASALPGVGGPDDSRRVPTADLGPLRDHRRGRSAAAPR